LSSKSQYMSPEEFRKNGYAVVDWIMMAKGLICSAFFEYIMHRKCLIYCFNIY